MAAKCGGHPTQHDAWRQPGPCIPAWRLERTKTPCTMLRPWSVTTKVRCLARLRPPLRVAHVRVLVQESHHQPWRSSCHRGGGGSGASWLGAWTAGCCRACCHWATWWPPSRSLQTVACRWCAGRAGGAGAHGPPPAPDNRGPHARRCAAGWWRLCCTSTPWGATMSGRPSCTKYVLLGAPSTATLTWQARWLSDKQPGDHAQFPLERAGAHSSVGDGLRAARAD